MSKFNFHSLQFSFHFWYTDQISRRTQFFCWIISKKYKPCMQAAPWMQMKDSLSMSRRRAGAWWRRSYSAFQKNVSSSVSTTMDASSVNHSVEWNGSKKLVHLMRALAVDRISTEKLTLCTGAEKSTFSKVEGSIMTGASEKSTVPLDTASIMPPQLASGRFNRPVGFTWSLIYWWKNIRVWIYLC